MRFQIRAGLSALAAAASVAVAVIAAPTAAQAADSRCPADKVCLFEKPNFQGGRFVLGSDSVYGGGCDRYLKDNRFDNGNAVDNHVSSIINNDQLLVWAYQGDRWPTEASSWYFMVGGGQALADLTSVRSWYGASGTQVYKNMDNQVSAVC